jgi:hypothetical protein
VIHAELSIAFTKIEDLERMLQQAQLGLEHCRCGRVAVINPKPKRQEKIA